MGRESKAGNDQRHRVYAAQPALRVATTSRCMAEGSTEASALLPFEFTAAGVAGHRTEQARQDRPTRLLSSWWLAAVISIPPKDGMPGSLWTLTAFGCPKRSTKRMCFQKSSSVRVCLRRARRWRQSWETGAPRSLAVLEAAEGAPEVMIYMASHWSRAQRLWARDRGKIHRKTHRDRVADQIDVKAHGITHMHIKTTAGSKNSSTEATEV